MYSGAFFFLIPAMNWPPCWPPASQPACGPASCQWLAHRQLATMRAHYELSSISIASCRPASGQWSGRPSSRSLALSWPPARPHGRPMATWCYLKPDVSCRQAGGRATGRFGAPAPCVKCWPGSTFLPLDQLAATARRPTRFSLAKALCSPC